MNNFDRFEQQRRIEEEIGSFSLDSGIAELESFPISKPQREREREREGGERERVRGWALGAVLMEFDRRYLDTISKPDP